ncbi:MAG: patatin-like phospholipase family protein [Clostridiales bacterium]|jgi:NTE family protein|nr:patatin-like phospholipase family protein [Clostridiales bacterium]
MKFGLALSGGATRGAAHIGALKAMAEEGMYPSWISGTSAGSMVAALYACGYNAQEMEEIAVSLNKSIYDTDYPGIFFGILQWILTGDTNWDGVMRGRKLESLMRKLTAEKYIWESRLPLAITSVDINTGRTVFFVSSKEKLRDDNDVLYIDDVHIYKAVRASIAIPVIFKPIVIQGMKLVDGGVTDNLPSDILRKMGADKVIGINLGYSGQRRDEISNILEIGSQTIDIMSYRMTKLKTTKADLVINPHIYDVGMLETHRIPELIERGYQAVKDNLYTIKRVINI